VSPGASGARAQDEKIKKTVKAHGGKVLFIGLDEKGKCFVLVNMSKVKDPKKLRAALKAVAGEAGIVLKSPRSRRRRARARSSPGKALPIQVTVCYLESAWEAAPTSR
jgi:hypothetical protein